MDLSPCFQKIFSFLSFLSKKRKYVLIEKVMYFRQADWLRWCKIIVVWSQCRSPERVKKMLWNSRQVIYRNINVRGDGLISLNFITMPSFLLYKHIKPAVIQVPYCKIVPRRCPSLELFCIFYLTVKNIIKFSPIFFQCTSCILNWIFDRQIA